MLIQRVATDSLHPRPLWERVDRRRASGGEPGEGLAPQTRCQRSWREPLIRRAWRATFSRKGRRKEDYCVFATCGGVAWVTNEVASSMAVPSGVGITMRNGTRMRVPTIGANAISIWRWPARYLITGRSGI